ncbi:hypothetical protein BgiMline_015909 [Biomphalaria glabrata]|nr:hypothetical protein BgiMline_008725 [Biomphalaria glabrata]
MKLLSRVLIKLINLLGLLHLEHWFPPLSRAPPGALVPTVVSCSTWSTGSHRCLVLHLEHWFPPLSRAPPGALVPTVVSCYTWSTGSHRCLMLHLKETE